MSVSVEWGVFIYACAWAGRCTSVEGLASAWEGLPCRVAYDKFEFVTIKWLVTGGRGSYRLGSGSVASRFGSLGSRSSAGRGGPMGRLPVGGPPVLTGAVVFQVSRGECVEGVPVVWGPLGTQCYYLVRMEGL